MQNKNVCMCLCLFVYFFVCVLGGGLIGYVYKILRFLGIKLQLYEFFYVLLGKGEKKRKENICFYFLIGNFFVYFLGLLVFCYEYVLCVLDFYLYISIGYFFQVYASLCFIFQLFWYSLSVFCSLWRCCQCCKMVMLFF